MNKAYIDIAGKWAFIFAYDINMLDLDEISSWLEALGARQADVRKACRVILGVNHGFTFSNTKQRMSVMCISKASSREQFLNTVAHEIDHLRYDICKYYDVEDGSEPEAYLQGFIMQGIVKVLADNTR